MVTFFCKVSLLSLFSTVPLYTGVACFATCKAHVAWLSDTTSGSDGCVEGTSLPLSWSP